QYILSIFFCYRLVSLLGRKQAEVYSLGYVDVSSRPRRSLFLRGARQEERRLVIPSERRITQCRAKTGPALRVARQMAPCCVAGLIKGVTIDCVPRLTERRPAWHHLTQQRGSR